MRSAKKRILFICGSLNQTTQLHAVSKELGDHGDHDLRFSPYYGDRYVDVLRRSGIIEFTIGGNKRRGWCLDYLRDHRLEIDLEARRGGYDLVVSCTDMVIPSNVRGPKLVVVQEGIFDPEGLSYRMVRRLKFLPRWAAGTATTGQSFLYDRFCAASEGYRQHLIARGADPAKVVATGIPNFDDCKRFLVNDFPYRGYLLVCTSDVKETFKRDERGALVRRALELAKGRRIIFKLHPNEDPKRETPRILRIAPEALVYSSGSAEHMIANCDVLMTEWSSTVFVGLALGKEVHTNFDQAELRRLMPVQNGGVSAKNIAGVCRELLGEGVGIAHAHAHGNEHEHVHVDGDVHVDANEGVA